MPMNSSRRSIARESAVLLGLACALALLVNTLRTDGIPLRENWTAKKFAAAAKSGERISLEMAYAAWKSRAALFVDAQAAEDYAQGHIPAALSLPFDPLAKDLETRVKALPKESPLILYCSAISCSLAEELAEYVRDFGYKNTLIMPEGIQGWRDAGYPIEK